MSGLIFRRVLQAFPSLAVVSVIMFLLLMVGPNPLASLKQNPAFTDKDVQRLTHEYGWDKPLMQQYTSWAGKFVRGDMGKSIVDRRPVKTKIMERLPLTMMMTGMSMILSLMIALPVGSYIAIKKYSKADYVATFTTFAMMASPSFFLALLLQLAALKMQDAAGGTLIFYTAGAPQCVSTASIVQAVTGCMGMPMEVFRRLALPVFALSILQIAGWSRYQRSELLGVLQSDFVKCAISKGLPFRQVFTRHILRNTMLPIITIVAIDVAGLFGGAVITERVFGLPGMGNLLLGSVIQRDVAVVLAIVMIGTLLVLFFNTVADVLYGVLDPRVRVA